MQIKYGDSIQLLIDDLVLKGTVTGVTRTEDRKEIREYFHIDLDTGKDEWSVSFGKITEKKDEIC